MSNSTILLSIVIPTKDRYDCLNSCLESFNSIFTDVEFEVVIFDTSLEIVQLNLESYNVKHLRQVVSSVSGFCETFSRAVDMSSGRYVVIIGDDDCVLPSLFDAVKWCDNHDVDSLTPSMIAGYIWPGIIRKLSGTGDADRLLVKRFSSTVEKVDALNALAECSKEAFQNFDRLPKIYHGLVKREKLDQVKNLLGDYFIGASPDISAAVALAQCCKDHYVIDLPLTLPGSSPKSGAGTSLAGKHIGDIAQSPLAPYAAMWPKMLPKIYTVQTMWAFSGIYVLEKLFKKDILKKFNPFKLLAAAIVYNPQSYSEILKASELKLSTTNSMRTILYIIHYAFVRFKQLVNRMLKRGSYDLIVDARNLSNIAGAQRYLIDNVKLSFPGGKYD